MNFLIRSIAVCVLVAILSVSAMANDMIGPFGLGLGQSSSADLRAQFPSATGIGMNRWSGGQMYSVEGRVLPLQGASRAVFIFDDGDRIAAVVITMNKNRFDAMRELLDARYHRVSAQLPFVGNRFVRWRAGEVMIDLDAPHMSFEMQLEYQTRRFLEQYEQGRREQQEARRRAEGEQL